MNASREAESEARLLLKTLKTPKVGGDAGPKDLASTGVLGGWLRNEKD